MSVIEATRFALANITGKGYAGDFGFKSAQELADDAGFPVDQVKESLDQLVLDGEILIKFTTSGQPTYSGALVICAVCCKDPCACRFPDPRPPTR